MVDTENSDQEEEESDRNITETLSSQENKNSQNIQNYDGNGYDQGEHQNMNLESR